MKGRNILKFSLRGVAGLVALLALLVALMLLLRPYWDLRGNFSPSFNFEQAGELFDRLEKDREGQKPYGATLSEEDFLGRLEIEPAFPQYRGPQSQGRIEETGLLTSWPKAGPPEVYRQPVGLGYAGLVVGGGLAFTIEQRRDSEVVVAYEFKTGTEVWTHAYPAAFVEQMGGDGPRASPTLDGARLYSLGAEGELICLSAATGEVEWSRNILTETKSRNLEWGMSGAPLIVDEKVIVTASGLGGASAMAYDKSTGKPVWSSDLGQQAYASLVLAELAGRPQLLDFAAHALNGVDPETGTKLWSAEWTGSHNGINCAQPLLLGDDRVFISSGYGKGAAAFKIREVGGQWSAEQLWAQTTMKNKFNSSVLVDGHIYGFDEGILACIDAETGERVWKGGRYGHGQLLVLPDQDVLLVVSEKGEVALVAATPDGFTELARLPAIQGRTWNHPALVGDVLLVRNSEETAAFRLALASE